MNAWAWLLLGAVAGGIAGAVLMFLFLCWVLNPRQDPWFKSRSW